MKEPHYQLVYSTKDHPSDALVLEPEKLSLIERAAIALQDIEEAQRKLRMAVNNAPKLLDPYDL